MQFKIGEKSGLPLETLKRLINSLFLQSLLLINDSYHVFLFLLYVRHLLSPHSVVQHRNYSYCVENYLRLRENKKFTQVHKEQKVATLWFKFKSVCKAHALSTPTHGLMNWQHPSGPHLGKTVLRAQIICPPDPLQLYSPHFLFLLAYLLLYADALALVVDSLDTLAATQALVCS